jgi:hypothetical protein
VLGGIRPTWRDQYKGGADDVQMTTLRRAATTQLAGAVFETATATEALACVCPCASMGHRSHAVCRLAIKPGDDYKVVKLSGSHPRPATVCMPCWAAIDAATEV